MRSPWFNLSRLLVQLRHLICRGLYEGQNALVDLLKCAWDLTGCPEPAWMRDDPGVLVDGPADAPATILLAPGSSEPADSRFMRTLARGLARKGWRVIRFDYPNVRQRRFRPIYGRRQRQPDSPERCEAAFLAEIEAIQASSPLFIGGKSLGAMTATHIANPSQILGCICFGYPFHNYRKPGRQSYRFAHLARLRTPTLIVQGTLDEYGGPEQVAGYALAPTIHIHWLQGCDHKYQTHTPQPVTSQPIAEAIATADAFIREQLMRGPATAI